MAFIRELTSTLWDRSARIRAVQGPLLILLSSGIVVSLVVTGAPATMRAAPVLIYIAVVPGLACVRLIRLPDRLATILLAIGLSLALATLMAMAMVYLRAWAPTRGIATLAALASIAAATELLERSALRPRIPRLRIPHPRLPRLPLLRRSSRRRSA